MFVGRSKELQELNNIYLKDENQVLILYGQWGIGKTTLLKKFLENKEYYFYKAVSCSQAKQRDCLARYLTTMGFSFSDLPEYKEIFSKLREQKEKKRILVIDQVHNLCKNDPEFLEIMNSVLMENSRDNDLLIILVSSSISWAENLRQTWKETGDNKQIIFYKIEELKYRDFKEYFSELSLEESIGVYGILGGIPGLWKYFCKDLSLKENVIQNILKKRSPMSRLGEQLVAEELRETSVYNTILVCLAEGKEKLNDIFHGTGFSRAKISVYLKNLMQLDLVEKVVSLDTDGREFTKKGVYRIRNSYVHFYYRFLFGKESLLYWQGEEAFYEKEILPYLNSFMKESFRQVCLDFIEKENLLGRLPGNFVYQGYWYGKKGSIDFIYEDSEEGEILAGICRLNKENLSMEEYQCFLECEKQSDIKVDFVIVFSMGGFDNYLREAAKKNPRLALISMGKMGL